MKIIIDVLNLLGFLLLLDFDVFFRWYLMVFCRKKLNLNKLDWWILNHVQHFEPMTDWELSHKQPLGFMLLFVGAVLSLILDYNSP